MNVLNRVVLMATTVIWIRIVSIHRAHMCVHVCRAIDVLTNSIVLKSMNAKLGNIRAMEMQDALTPKVLIIVAVNRAIKETVMIASVSFTKWFRFRCMAIPSSVHRTCKRRRHEFIIPQWHEFIISQWYIHPFLSINIDPFETLSQIWTWKPLIYILCCFEIKFLCLHIFYSCLQSNVPEWWSMYVAGPMYLPDGLRWRIVRTGFRRMCNRIAYMQKFCRLYKYAWLVLL